MVTNLEGFFDVQVMKEESTNDSKIPGNLNAKAHDAYLLFQVLFCVLVCNMTITFVDVQDLVQLTNGDPSSWLAADLKINKSLGLELLENVLNSFPRIFLEV